MASNKIVGVPVVFILALLLVSGYVEAEICARPNPHYPGACRSNKDCAGSCIQQNLGTSGYCKGSVPLFKSCYCTFECPMEDEAEEGGH
ncbi:hypothetical protein ZEAMMB73_Zm00001d042229 [Zea mays]|uniref:Knottins-like domain-containing protein n=1 Tax=Zea mays TaxID=4577 RepID=A0A1D6N294_MAIZE|nr:hypothetical protein ZEAMMB73_Zm00001d042229 [Zea mays]